MLRNEYKLSDVLSDNDTLENAARIVAKVCLSGAIENQENWGGAVTYAALNDWGFYDIFECYCEHVFTIPEARMAEPTSLSGELYDELIIDADELSDEWCAVRGLALEIMEKMAKDLDSVSANG